ncbi:MAG: diaminopimelate decarboxylase [Oscillospiraceae bacterium]|nr:diaminopimelate decarboxylase [Oscillospiraceae bacterium]
MMKKPFITKDEAEKIASKYPTPFHIYDEKGILDNLARLRKAFSWNPGFKEYFAVKATPNPIIIKLLTDSGCGVDCSSYTELLMAKALGLSGNDIMFSSNMTPEKDYILAHELGGTINLDDISHIDFVSNLFKLPEKMSCRYNPGGYFEISNNIMDNPGDAKYGFTRPQIFEGFKKMIKLGVKEFGIHAFLASNTKTNEYYPALASKLFNLAVELKRETGANITFINLSGGIGIPYRPEDPENDIMKIGEGVRKEFESILVPAGMGNISIYTELGRFMLGPYGALVARAIHYKNTYKHYIGLDACAANLMRPAMYGAYHHITVLGKENAECDHVYDVVGGLCENNDKFAIDRALPIINIGDIIYIHDTGAHGFSMGYNYNGKLRSAEILYRSDKSFTLIRRAETPEDYFSTLDVTGIFKNQ